MTLIKEFTDLNTWKEGHKLVLKIYQITDNFPNKEIYTLVSQMRRCAISITSNIAEGFGRSTIKDKNQFYNIAMASTYELKNQIILSKDLKYISLSEYNDLIGLLNTASKLLKGLSRSSMNKPV